jgi:alpha-glucosidase
MVGPDLLVAAAPFLEKADDYDATLPSTGWYDLWTGKLAEPVHARILSGNIQPNIDTYPPLPAVRIHPELATLPVFVRPGAILPIAPLVQSTAERPAGPLTLRVFPGPNCAGHLYQDDGTTFAYQRGHFLRMSFTCEVSPNREHLTIHIGKHIGLYPAWWHQIAVQVNGLSNKPASITIDGHPATFTTTDYSITITMPDQGNGIDIALSTKSD